jgi:hypothetical protein
MASFSDRALAAAKLGKEADLAQFLLNVYMRF